MSKKDELVERFLRYVSVSSQSDASVATVPSSKGQLELANLLSKELRALGLEDVFVDEHAIVYATLKGNTKGPAIGFVAHLDTVDVSLSPVIKPKIVSYKGGDVVLNEKENIILKLKEHPELNDYINQDIIFTDGTSVLGADNKVAIAVIMTMLSMYSKDASIEHPEIKVAFVPDEEIGLKGSKLMDLTRFKVDFAYTIDCCSLGEIVYETFNAGSVSINIKGISAHPMSAKGVLVNPLLVAHDFIAMFDREQTPECTAGYDGYWWFSDIKSDATYCHLGMLIRDHDKDLYQKRKQTVLDNIEKLKSKHERAEISCEITDTYENIANRVKRDDLPVDLVYKACDELNIKTKPYAMRGGTDGSALCVKGIVTPNYFTGAHNFHSNSEFLPIDSFEKSLDVTLKIVELSMKI